MKDIVVLGGGGHGKVLINILNKLKDFRVIGYTDIKQKGYLLGAEYIGSDDKLKGIIDSNPLCAAAIGLGMNNNSDAVKRREMYSYLKELGYEVPAIVSPTAVINEDVFIADGTVVMDGVVINSGTKIKECVILNTRCSVDHDCRLAGFAHVSPGATLCGGVNLGSDSIIGAGAVVNPSITISDGCVIGSGSVVVKDCMEQGIYAGVPVRIVK